MNKVIKKKFKAFTLLELVIVIAIITVLIGIAVPKYSESRKNAKIAAHNANVRAVQNAAVMHLTENDNSDISSGDLVKYFADDKVPKPLIDENGKEIKEDRDFNISVNDGKVTISPGEYKNDSK